GGLTQAAGGYAGGDHVDGTTVAATLGIQLYPAALFKAGHAFHDLVRDACATNDGATIVIEFDQIAVFDALRLGVLDADQNMLTALNVLLVAHAGVGHLGVKAMERMRTDHMHLAFLCITQVFDWFQKLGDGGAIGYVGARNGFAVELDLA